MGKVQNGSLLPIFLFFSDGHHQSILQDMMRVPTARGGYLPKPGGWGISLLERLFLRSSYKTLTNPFFPNPSHPMDSPPFLSNAVILHRDLISLTRCPKGRGEQTPP